LREKNESLDRSSRLEELKFKQKKLLKIREEVTMVKELDISVYRSPPLKTNPIKKREREL
ncbi:hypothetical protein Tco_1359045, partial [Tanacetum coccineum]